MEETVYTTPNGQQVGESELKSYYGDEFDSLVEDGTLKAEVSSTENIQPSNGEILYTTPNGMEVGESELKSYYGDEFDSLVQDGTLKKKDEPEFSSQEEGMESTTKEESTDGSLESGEAKQDFSFLNQQKEGYREIRDERGRKLDIYAGNPLNDTPEAVKFSQAYIDASPQYQEYKSRIEKLSAARERGKGLTSQPEAPDEKQNIQNFIANESTTDGSVSMMSKAYQNNKQYDVNNDGVIDQKDIEAVDKKKEAALTEHNKEVDESKSTYKTIFDETGRQFAPGDDKIQELKKYTERKAVEIENQKKEWLEKERLSNQRNEQIANDQEFAELLTNDSLSKIAKDNISAEDRIKAFNKQFGRYGFSAMPTISNAIGNGFGVVDINGNVIDVDLDQIEDFDLLTEFLKNNADLNISPKDDLMDVANKKAVKFFEDKGLNYYAVSAGGRNYKHLQDKLTLADALLEDPNSQYQKYSEEDTRRFPDLFMTLKNGIVVPKTPATLAKIVEDGEQQYEKLAEVYGAGSVFDTYISDTMDEFDFFAEKERQNSMALAAEVDKASKKAYDVSQAESERIFGKQFQDIEVVVNEKGEIILGQGDLKTLNDYEQYRQLSNNINSINISQKEAANSYLNARTFFDMKFDKSITENTKRNYEGFKGEFNKGYKRGSAGDVLLWYGMGLTGHDSQTREEMSKEVAAYLQSANNSTESLALKRHNRYTRKGFFDSGSEYWATVFRDPFEVAGALFANSMSQMLPYGLKIAVPIMGARIVQRGRQGAIGGAAATAAVGGEGGIPGLAIGAGLGAIEGAGETFAIASGLVEYTNAILDVAAEKGYNPTLPQDWKTAMEDDEVWKDARNRGLARGVPIALVNMLTVKMGGKIFGAGRRAFTQSAVAKSAMVGAEFSTVTLGEGLGEVAAQASRMAFIGDQDKFAWNEVGDEMLGSLGAPVQYANIAKNMYDVNSRAQKIQFAESLTDVKNIMKETASPKKILAWTNNMRETGQIDDVTYQQITDNLAAKKTAQEYIKNGNPDLAIAEEEVASEVATEEAVEDVAPRFKGAFTNKKLRADQETTTEEAAQRVKNRDKKLFDETQEAPGIPGAPKISDVTTDGEVSTGVYSNENGQVDIIISSTGTNQNFVGYYRVYENGKPTNKFTSKMQVVDGKGFGKMIANAQTQLPEGHQWMETKSVSKDGLRVWNKSKEKGYKESVDENGNVITKEVTLNQATKEGITGKSTDYKDVVVSKAEADNIVNELQEIYPGIETSTIKGGPGKVKIKIKLPVLESTTETTTEAVTEDVAPTDQETVSQKTTVESVIQKVRGRGRKAKLKSRVAELIKSRNFYQQSKEIYGPQISEINKEINEIITSGKVRSKENQVKLPQLGQSYTVNGRKYNAKQFVKILNKMSSKDLINSNIIIRNPNQEVQDILKTKNQEIDAIQKPSTEKVDVQQQSTDGETLGTRDTQETPTQESQEKIQVDQTQVKIEKQLEIDGITPEFKEAKDNIPTLTIYEEGTDKVIEKIIGKEAVEKAKAEGKKGQRGTDLVAVRERVQIIEIGGKKYKFTVQLYDDGTARYQVSEIDRGGISIKNLSKDEYYNLLNQEEVQVDQAKKEVDQEVTLEPAVTEDGEIDYEAEDKVRNIAKERDLGITSDREIAFIARDKDGKIVGGAYTSYDNSTGKYTFDVVVDKSVEGKGVGSKLLDQVKDLPFEIQDMNPEATVEVDVVSPVMEKMLKSKGFEVIEKIGPSRFLMSPKTETPTTEVSEVVEETKVDQEVEKVVKDEAEVLAQALGLNISSKKGDARFEIAEEVELEDEVSIKKIEDAMNKMLDAQIQFTEPTSQPDTKVNAVKVSKVNKKEIAKALKKLGLNEDEVIVTLEEFDNTPTLMAMSDVLATGKSLKDSQGNPIDVRGGLMYNLLGPNKNLAWAGVDFEGAQKMVDNAVKVYQNNKEYFNNWWADNPKYKGMVPLTVMRMADSAIYSNEATFRWINPTIKKYSLEARTEAFKTFVKDLDKPITGKDLKKAKADFKKFLENNPEIKTIDQLLDAVVKDSQERAKKKTKEDATAEAGHLPLDSKKYLFHKIFSPAKTQKVGGRLIAKTLNDIDSQPDQKSMFSEKLLLDDIGEPAMMQARKGDVMGFMGIDVINPKVVRADHQNYGWGPKGKFLGVLETPTNGINVFPEFFAKASRVFKPEIEKATGKPKSLPSKEKVRDQVGGSFFIDNAFVGARIKASKMSPIEIITAKLRYAFPQVNVINSQQEFNKKINEPGVLTSKVKGKVILGLTKDGQIYLNPDKATLATPIHEFGHIWIDFLRSKASGKKGTALLNKGLELIKDTSYYEKAKKKYGEFDADGNLTNEDLVLEEALVEGIATKGENIAKASVRSNFLSWLNGMYKYIQEKFTTSKETKMEDIANLSIDDFQNIALADLFSGKTAMEKEAAAFDPAFEAGKTSRARFEVMGGLSAIEIIREGRKQGFTDASIIEVVKSMYPKLTIEEIKSTIDFEGGQIGLFQDYNVPASFGNVIGGMREGIAMLSDIRNTLKKTKKKRDKEGKPLTRIQMREMAGKLLRNHEVYKLLTGNKQLQKQLEVDLDKLMDIDEGKNLSERMDLLKTQIRSMKVNESNLQSMKKRITSLLRQQVAIKEVTKSEYNKALRILRDAKLDNFDASMLKIEKLAEDIEVRQKKALIAETIKNFTNLAKVGRSKSGRTVSKGRIDASGIRFFAEAAKQLKAFAKNDEKTINRLQAELFDVVDGLVTGVKAEVQAAVDKMESETKDSKATREEMALVNKLGIYSLLSQINSKSLEDIKSILQNFKNVEDASRQQLGNQIYQRARRNREIKEGTDNLMSESFNDIITSDRTTFRPVSNEEKTTFGTKVLDKWDGNSESTVEVDGKTFRVVIEETVSEKTKKISTKNVIQIQEKEFLTEDEIKDNWASLRERILSAKGKDKAAGKIVNEMLKSFKKIKDKRFYIKFFNQLAKNPASSTNTLLRLMETKNNKFLSENVIDKLADMSEDYIRGKFNQKDYMDALANSIFGFDKGIQGVMDNASKNVDLKMEKGVKNFNIGELMNLYALMKNEETALMILEGGRGSFKFRSDLQQQLDEILDSKTKEFVDRTVEYLSDQYYEGVNEVYEATNYVSLPKTKNYFPRQVKTDQKTQQQLVDAVKDGDFHKAFNAQYASALKNRSANLGQVQTRGRDFFSVLDNHFSEMEKFKAYAEGLKDVSAVFKSDGISKAMLVTGSNSRILKQLTQTINPEALMELMSNDLLDKNLSRFTVGVLAFKAVQILKQATSFITAYADYNYNPNFKPKGAGGVIAKEIQDALGFAYDTARMAINYRKNFQEAKKVSATFRDRVEDGDLYSLATGIQRNRSVLNKGKFARKFEKAAGWTTQVGDQLGVMGYFINYKRNIENGMSRDKALRAFNKYNETQQTRRAQDLSAIQLMKSPFLRLFTAFASTSILQLNKFMQESYNMVINKDFSKRTVRSMALNVSLANALFFTAGNFLRLTGDEEDEEKFVRDLTAYATGLKMFQSSLIILGDIFEAVNLMYLNDMDPYSARNRASKQYNPIVDTFFEFYAGLQDVSDKTKTDKEVESAYRRMATKMLYLSSVNIDPLLAMSDLFKDDVELDETIPAILGFPKGALKDPKDPDKPLRWINFEAYQEKKTLEKYFENLPEFIEMEKQKNEIKEDIKEEKGKALFD